MRRIENGNGTDTLIQRMQNYYFLLPLPALFFELILALGFQSTMVRVRNKLGLGSV